ncbi:MAG: hypothetical protein OEY20_10215 [Gemmatimonadota bacterium]|nr:hypothetical protein [Gemmatimonadota bacterium]MDH4349965.1 hypothetical protein [Gemmatimonadota bacterium]MDH5197615.1 hypothetical protein [Gemmatimonadota bacterium]
MTPRTEDESDERRTQRVLREALDELVQHVRVVRRTLPTMAPHEIEYAQERLEWLADEVWRIALDTDAEHD